MAQLLSDFSHSREGIFRHKKLILVVGVLVVAAAIALAGFFIFQKKQQAERSKVENSGLLPSSWLIKYFGTDRDGDPKIGGPDGDPDRDLLTNYQEFYFNTNPAKADTDGDGQVDGAEVAVNKNPTGEGELYSTEYAKSIADQFIEDNGLEEFKEENIRKQVLGVLNPPDLKSVEVVLPDERTLNMTSEVTQKSVQEYLQKVQGITGSLDSNAENYQNMLDDPQGTEVIKTLGHINEIIDKLREISVPQPFLTYHQLHIAGIQAASRIFDEAKKLDETVDIESQKTVLSQQAYQIALIQKINEMSEIEFTSLTEKFKNE